MSKLPVIAVLPLHTGTDMDNTAAAFYQSLKIVSGGPGSGLILFSLSTKLRRIDADQADSLTALQHQGIAIDNPTDFMERSPAGLAVIRPGGKGGKGDEEEA